MGNTQKLVEDDLAQRGVIQHTLLEDMHKKSEKTGEPFWKRA